MSKQPQITAAVRSPRLVIVERLPTSSDINETSDTERDPRTKSRMPVTLSMTPVGNDRLVTALASGRDEYILTDLSGGVSVRVCVAIDSAALGREVATTLDGASIDWSSGRLERGGHQTVLSRIELRLLACLIDAQSNIVPHARLIECAWPDNPPKDPENALAVYVNYLRRRLKPIGLGGAIRTFRSAGYALISTVTARELDDPGSPT